MNWGDIQDLLASGALSSADLADCLSKVGLEVNKAGKSTSSSQNLSFENFFDLLMILDEFIDESKLPDGDDEAGISMIIILYLYPPHTVSLNNMVHNFFLFVFQMSHQIST